jgi:hypothetical protein
MTGRAAPAAKPFSQFFDINAPVPPVRSRVLAPPPESPPATLHPCFLPATPAPVSQFLPPAAGVTPPPEDDDPPPTPPTIPPSKRKLHALWKAKNFRKPFTPWEPHASIDSVIRVQIQFGSNLAGWPARLVVLGVFPGLIGWKLVEEIGPFGFVHVLEFLCGDEFHDVFPSVLTAPIAAFMRQVKALAIAFAASLETGTKRRSLQACGDQGGTVLTLDHRRTRIAGVNLRREIVRLHRRNRPRTITTGRFLRLDTDRKSVV